MKSSLAFHGTLHSSLFFLMFGVFAWWVTVRDCWVTVQCRQCSHLAKQGKVARGKGKTTLWTSCQDPSIVCIPTTVINFPQHLAVSPALALKMLRENTCHVFLAPHWLPDIRSIICTEIKYVEQKGPSILHNEIAFVFCDKVIILAYIKVSHFWRHHQTAKVCS